MILTNYNFNLLSLSELLITEMLLSAMAAAANIGLISIPIIGYRTPAATGIKMEL